MFSVATILALLGKLAPGIATAIGDYLIKSKQTQVESDKVGASLSVSYLQSITDANRSRVEARRAEGAWGPIGIVTFVVGIVFAIHAAAVVGDSLPLLPGIAWTGWGIIPYPTLVAHSPCRCVAALPTAFQAVELEVFRALFYTAPPSAAAVVIAKAFRR